MNSVNLHLKKSFLLDDEQANKMNPFFKEEKIAKGDFFLKHQQYCDRLSFIESGYLRLFGLEGDKEITQWISSERSFVTDLSSFLFGTRARWNIQALSDCTLFSITKDQYRKLKDEFSNWSEIENRFLASCFVTLENRVFNHLSLTAEERYDQLFSLNKELFNQVPLQYLASMLGMSPETLSRIRQKKIS